VLINLIGNALDAMREQPQRALWIDAAAQDGRVALRVRDQGPGLDPALRDRVFEPFFSTKSAGGGLGLGLAISRDIAREAGGELEADNHPDGGACFTLWLPPVPPTPCPEPMSQELSVLLVEDDLPMQLGCLQALQLAGLTVDAVESAEAARPRLTAGFPGVVVTDMRLPGADGLSLVRHCHELEPELPVIMITGHGDVSLAVEAMRSGAYDFIPKPFSPEVLVEVRRALDKRALTLEVVALREALARKEGGSARSSAAHRRWWRCASWWPAWPRPGRTCSSAAKPAPARNWWPRPCTICLAARARWWP
jgi:CheY-like chemotaxis protein